MRIVVWNQKANDGETENIEKSDTPKDLLDRRWERLAWVCCLGSGKTNQFGTGKCESSCDKDTTQSLESIVKSSGIRPVFTPNVSTCGTSSAVDYYTEKTVKRSAVLNTATA